MSKHTRHMCALTAQIRVAHVTYEGWSISFEPNIFKLKTDRLAYFHFSA